MIVRDDLPPTPDWTYTPWTQPVLTMPLLWLGDQA